jgi:uncharacterized protein with GYD domain
MPTYVVLVNWTEEGIKNVKETIERTDEGTEHLLEVCASGYVRTTTMRAYDREEMSSILEKLS